MIIAVTGKGEPMSLINREDLLQTLGITDMDCAKCGWYSRTARRCKRGSDFEDACCAIDDAPEVKPEPKWIPCVDGNEPKANAECWISTNAKFVRRASYAPKANNQPNGFIVTDGGFGFYEYGKSAKAWMPYTKEPEPYQEEGGN